MSTFFEQLCLPGMEKHVIAFEKSAMAEQQKRRINTQKNIVKLGPDPYEMHRGRALEIRHAEGCGCALSQPDKEYLYDTYGPKGLNYCPMCRLRGGV
ncbi:hypothetical protein [Celeribacter baekdonensis]|uniref:Uncharacterized protein n=1 Tax=Celeribacter baekdonensis B30 TaxID=1208323 RepID=K2K2L6_9RHOB|nr:hypothetical protein [Celeribacter baekdonensis]EKE71715.1 hypothetical protein B30_08093 [Celeribacter baekdonensis B30]